MNRHISKVAVLGSGVMGSAIACHFANIGCAVQLFDLAPTQLTPEEQAKDLTLDDKKVKNRIVNTSFNRVIRSKPAPLFSKKFIPFITLRNFESDLHNISDCDWIVEAVAENITIKKKLYAKVEEHRKPRTLITSNTSGIPIGQLIAERSEDFRKNFCGTHFFNPPRYLKLLEIIPSPHTDPEIVQFLMHYGDLYLGKTTVQCKDTPAFIGNRIGVWSMLKTIEAMHEYQLTIDDIDKLTGTIVGRPKSATFRTSDLVGIDTLAKVADNLYAELSDDERRETFKLPDKVRQLEKKGWLGDKSGQGFYKKIKNPEGKTEILTLDFDTMEYKPRTRIQLASLEAAKAVATLPERLRTLLAGNDKAGKFYRNTFFALFEYTANRIPDISDTIFSIDAAMRAGFGWEFGPFETWDALGVSQTLATMKQEGYKPSRWINDMIAADCTSFYRIEGHNKMYYDIPTRSYKAIPGKDAYILLEHFGDNNTIWQNAESKITNLGDGVINLSWHSKGYTLGTAVMEGINTAIDLAEKEYDALVIGHQGTDFSLGANLGLVFMYAVEQDYEELDLMVRAFQNTVMRIRYSAIPVVVAPHGRTLGGGCEITLHADSVQAAAETYIGLVELGVGLIPAGGGSKELTKRVSDARQPGDVVLNDLQNAFMQIAMAKVATSAIEATEMGILRAYDNISINKDRQIADAKAVAMHLARTGYTQPLPDNDITVQGTSGKALFIAGINGMREGKFISEHDTKIATKLAHVMCGGDLTAPQAVSEQYLLDLEREAFLSLCGEQKTLERIQAVLKGGKPLRN